ncbi:hypothetical protein [Formosa sp. PL04]|uniref:hypothetical protein n=1 Tax=Formosa sp. PL04 TaxID=3081755 RepID=UPI0029826572|nr:hypothetical protein [Formosa sp. PL04]MDW5290645.1 hypothetical protein [Formosa sp. PL04]
MRKLVVLLALTLSVLAIILGSLTVFLYALIPACIALILGYFGMKISKNQLKQNKTAQLAIVLSVLAILLVGYKLAFMTSETEPETTKEVKVKKRIIEEELDDYELELLEFKEDSIRGLREHKIDTITSKTEL